MNIETLRRLIHVPAIASYEARALAFCSEEFQWSPGQVHVTQFPFGACLTKTTNPDSNTLGFIAHFDTIGLMVKHIDDNGFIYFTEVGGWDPAVLLSQRVWIHTASATIRGVISRVAIHMMEEEEEEKLPKIHELVVDIGASNKEEAKQLVRVGDPITLDSDLVRVGGKCISGHGLDDRVGCYIALELLNKLDNCTIYLTSHEETAYCYGSARIVSSQMNYLQPNLRTLIGLDMTHATDTPEVAKGKHGDLALDGGPVIVRGSFLDSNVVDDLVGVAAGHSIPYQLEASPQCSCSDLDFVPFTRPDIQLGLVCVPTRYMHTSVEMVSTNAIDQTIDLLTQYAYL